MPSKPARPCRVPYCAGLSRDGSGYCLMHAEVARRKDNARRNARRPGAARTDLPRKAKERDGCCRRCRWPGSPSNPLKAHHIIPLAQGGPNTLDNFMTLCDRCHKEVHRAATRQRKP